MEILYASDFRDRLIFVENLDTFFLCSDGKHYQPTLPSALKKRIWSYVNAEYFDKAITDGIISDVYKQMIYACERTMSSLPCELISFKDVVLNTKDFTTQPHSLENVSTFFLPIEYETVLNAPEAPIFQQFLRAVLVTKDDPTVTDETLVTVMQEIMGYMLLPQLHAASAFFFVGDGANGKSKLADVITAMIGSDFVSAMSIETLTTRPFFTAALVGKRLNICNEEESKYVKSDKFKALISGDVISAERKYGNPFEFRPTAKYIFCSNRLPTFDGINYGLRRRIKIIPFNRRFEPKDRDLHIAEKMCKEMPGIIHWALAGAKRLIANNFEFSDGESAAMIETMQEFENEISSAILFYRTNYQHSDMHTESNADMYANYRNWSQANGRKALNRQNFFNDIGKKFPEEKSIQIWDKGKNIKVRRLAWIGEMDHVTANSYSSAPVADAAPFL